MKISKIIESIRLEYLKNPKVLKKIDDICRKNSLCLCCRQEKSVSELCKKCQKKVKHMVLDSVQEDYV